MPDDAPSPDALAVATEEAAALRRHLRRARLKATFAGLGVLVVGMMLGAAGLHVWQQKQHTDTDNAPRVPSPQRPPSPPPPERWAGHLVDRLAKDLSLDAATREKIKPVVEAHAKAWFAIRAQTMQRIHEETMKDAAPVQEQFRQAVAEQLTPDQQARWKELFDERYFRGPGWPERRGGGRRRGPPPHADDDSANGPERHRGLPPFRDGSGGKADDRSPPPNADANGPHRPPRPPRSDASHDGPPPSP